MGLHKKGNAIIPVRIRALDMESGIQRFAAVATTRLAYSSEDNQGRRAAMEMMRELGLVVRIDAAGNIFGRRAGAGGGPPILFGSHIDTVRDAGRYDGVLGVVSGMECIRALCEMNHQTEHPLELVIFANEEGQTYSGLLGSRAMVGDFGSEELKQTDAKGRALGDAIRQIGGTRKIWHLPFCGLARCTLSLRCTSNKGGNSTAEAFPLVSSRAFQEFSKPM